jgi:Methylase involved in ubiquinone/menaquinone biosynthesis
MIDKSLNYGRPIVEHFLNESQPFESVIDIGAGNGDDLAIAKKIIPSSKLMAIECCDYFVHQLQTSGIVVHQLNIERDSLPYTDESIDVVIANQILEHTKEIYWIFHEITRVLPVGGKVILGVPNLASLHNRLLLLFGKQPTSIKTSSAHIRGFTRGDILRFLEDCYPGGYELKNFGGSNFYPFPRGVAKILSRAFPSMAWGIFLHLEKRRKYQNEFINFPHQKDLQTNFYIGNLPQ